MKSTLEGASLQAEVFIHISPSGELEPMPGRPIL